MRLQQRLALGTRNLGEGSMASGRAFVVRGYSGVEDHPLYDGRHMYQSKGTIRSILSNGVFYHRASTESGMSGAGEEALVCPKRPAPSTSAATTAATTATPSAPR